MADKSETRRIQPDLQSNHCRFGKGMPGRYRSFQHHDVGCRRADVVEGAVLTSHLIFYSIPVCVVLLRSFHWHGELGNFDLGGTELRGREKTDYALESRSY